MTAWLFALVFGLTAAEPGADYSTEVVMDAPAQADVFVYVNTEATAKPMWDWIRTELPKEKLVAEIPNAEKELERGIGEMEAAVAELEGKIGMKPLEDVKFAAAWFEARHFAGGDLEEFGFLVKIHGNFPSDLVANAVAKSGAPVTESKLMGRTVYEVSDDGMTFAVSQLGTQDIIFGTADLVRPRAGGNLASQAPAPDNQLGRIEAKIKAGAIIMVDLAPSKLLRTEIAGGVPSTSASELMTGFESFGLALFADGLDLDVVARTDAMYERYAHLGSSLEELVRAGRAGSRAIVHGIVGVLSAGDPELPKDLEPFLQNSDAVLDVVDRYIGDGDVGVTDASDEGEKTVSLSLRADHVRQITIPLGFAFLGLVSL